MMANNGHSTRVRLGIIAIVIMFALALGRVVHLQTKLSEEGGRNDALTEQLDDVQDQLDESNDAIRELSTRLTQLGFAPIFDEDGNLIEDSSSPSSGGIGVPDSNNGGSRPPNVNPSNPPSIVNPPSNPPSVPNNPPASPPIVNIPSIPLVPDELEGEFGVPGIFGIG